MPEVVSCPKCGTSSLIHYNIWEEKNRDEKGLWLDRSEIKIGLKCKQCGNYFYHTIQFSH